MCTLWITQGGVGIAAVPLTNARDDDLAMYDPNLFEGDIVITPEEFQKYYGVPLSDDAEKVSMQNY